MLHTLAKNQPLFYCFSPRAAVTQNNAEKPALLHCSDINKRKDIFKRNDHDLYHFPTADPDYLFMDWYLKIVSELVYFLYQQLF